MCQVLGRQRHMSVSSAAIRGRNVRCLLPGSWADAGGSSSAIFWKAELECSPRPQGLSAGLPLCLDRGADMQINLSLSFACSLSPFLSLALLRSEVAAFQIRRGEKKKTVQVEKYYQSHTDEPLSSNTEQSTKNMTHGFHKHCFCRVNPNVEVQRSIDHMPVRAEYLWITGIIAAHSHDYYGDKKGFTKSYSKSSF